jgi:hypothetical protein
MTTSSKAAGLVLATALLLSASASFAQSASDLESARDLYKQARELRTKGDLKGALEKFKGANALAATPITALELGRTYMQVGQLLEAREAFLSVSRLKVQPDESERSAAARAEAVELAEQVRPRIPSLVVHVPAGASVTVDGAPVPADAVGLPRKLNPGPHDVAARFGEGPEDKKTVNLKEAESAEVTLAPKAPEGIGPTGPGPAGSGHEAGGGASGRQAGDEPAPKKAIHPLVWVGAGVGVAGLGFGTVAGIVTLSKKSTINELCQGTRCPPAAESTVTAGRTWATLSTISVAVGLVGIGVGVVGFFLPTKAAAKPSTAQRALGALGALDVGPRWLGVRGSFQ